MLGSSNQITGTAMTSLSNIKGFGNTMMGGAPKNDPYSFSIDDDKKQS